jgi:hypothetical protein
VKREQREGEVEGAAVCVDEVDIHQQPGRVVAGDEELRGAQDDVAL